MCPVPSSRGTRWGMRVLGWQPGGRRPSRGLMSDTESRIMTPIFIFLNIFVVVLLFSLLRVSATPALYLSCLPPLLSPFCSIYLCVCSHLLWDPYTILVKFFQPSCVYETKPHCILFISPNFPLPGTRPAYLSHPISVVPCFSALSCLPGQRTAL